MIAKVVLVAALVAIAQAGVPLGYGGYGGYAGYGGAVGAVGYGGLGYAAAVPAYAKVAAPVAVAKAVAIEAPQPYDFGYSHHTDDGAATSRQESSDAHNNKQGSYSIQNPDGTYRHVQYVADAAGFRAVIKTNEHGTAPQPAAATQILAEEPPYKVLPAPAPIVKAVASPLIAKAAIAAPVYAGYGHAGLGLRGYASPAVGYGGLGLRAAYGAPAYGIHG